MTSEFSKLKLSVSMTDMNIVKVILRPLDMCDIPSVISE